MTHPARSDIRPGRDAGPTSAGATALGRRERKKLATRTAVRDAALRLAVRHGVENVTVEQIAAEADIALRTFFNHFASKEEAVVAAAAAGAEALIAEFRVRPSAESVLDAIRESVLAVMDRDDASGRDHVTALRLMREEPSLVPQQMALLTAQERALAEAIAERVGSDATPGTWPSADDLYPHLCAAAALAALRVALDRWLDRAPDVDDAPPLSVLREQATEAISRLAAGLDRPGSARDS